MIGCVVQMYPHHKKCVINMLHIHAFEVSECFEVFVLSIRALYAMVVFISF